MFVLKDEQLNWQFIMWLQNRRIDGLKQLVCLDTFNFNNRIELGKTF